MNGQFHCATPATCTCMLTHQRSYGGPFLGWIPLSGAAKCMEAGLRDNAIQVEVVKVAMTQDKSGYYLKLALHPSDDIAPLVNAHVGARFVAAFVEVDDSNQPVHKKKTNTQVMQAGMLTQQPDFREWFHASGYSSGTDEDSVLKGLYKMLGITSRSQLADPDKQSARDVWDRVYRAFIGTRGF